MTALDAAEINVARTKAEFDRVKALPRPSMLDITGRVHDYWLFRDAQRNYINALEHWKHLKIKAQINEKISYLSR